MHGAVQNHRRGHAFEPESADEGGGLPVAVRYRRAAALAPRRPAVAARHLGRSPGFIDEHQALGVEIDLGLEPGAPATQNVSALLLARVCGFF